MEPPGRKEEGHENIKCVRSDSMYRNTIFRWCPTDFFGYTVHRHLPGSEHNFELNTVLCPPPPTSSRSPRPPFAQVQLTSDLFKDICGRDPEPKDIYLAVTVGGRGGGDDADGIKNALQGIGVPVVLCSSHRLTLAISRSLVGTSRSSESCDFEIDVGRSSGESGGVASSGSGSGAGSGSTAGEKETTPVKSCNSNGVNMRSVVDRAMAVVEFLVSWPWSTADGDIVLEERIDELAVLLELARRTDSR